MSKLRQFGRLEISAITIKTNIMRDVIEFECFKSNDKIAHIHIPEIFILEVIKFYKYDLSMTKWNRQCKGLLEFLKMDMLPLFIDIKTSYSRQYDSSSHDYKYPLSLSMEIGDFLTMTTDTLYVDNEIFNNNIRYWKVKKHHSYHSTCKKGQHHLLALTGPTNVVDGMECKYNFKSKEETKTIFLLKSWMELIFECIEIESK